MTYSTIRNRSADKFKKKKRNKQNVFHKKTIVFRLYIKLLHKLFEYPIFHECHPCKPSKARKGLSIAMLY